MGSKETPIQKDCMDLLKMNGIVHWRQQVLFGFFRPNKNCREYYVRQGTKGLADIGALLPNGNGSLYCEVKQPSGKQSEDQKAFEKVVIKSGGHYIVVYSWVDLAEYLYALGLLTVRL